MNSKEAMRISSILVAVLFAEGVWAQADSVKKMSATKTERSANSAEKPPQVTEEGVLKKPPALKFSMQFIEAGRIDKGYAGVSAEEVVGAVEKITGFVKGEFESTADFNARKAAAIGGRLLGDYRIEDAFGFVVPVARGGESTNGMKYRFNADTGEVSLYALPMSLKYLGLNGIGAPDYQTNRREGKGLDRFDLETKIESKSTYQGGNEFGSMVTVERTVMSKFGLAVNKIPFLNFERDLVYSKPLSVGKFHMSNSDAARELPALKALVVLKLAEPYIYYNFRRVEPKRDSPVDISVQEKFLAGNVLGVVFFSGLSGEVLARIPEGFGRKNPEQEEGQSDSKFGATYLEMDEKFVGMRAAPENAMLGSDFYEGRLRLSYSVFGRGMADGPELRSAYDQKRWGELVANVVKKRFVMDVYYFYLGRAAEELGAPKAARVYYELALDAQKCTNGGLWNSCAEFNFPDAIHDRYKGLGKQ